MRLKKRKSRLYRKIKRSLPLIFVLAMLWVWKSTVAVDLSRELTQLRRTRDSLIEKNKQLAVQLERYRSIAWIDSCAGYGFGMNTDMRNREFIYEDAPIDRNATGNKSNYAGLSEFWSGLVRLLRGY